jgi:hypothetical protein
MSHTDTAEIENRAGLPNEQRTEAGTETPPPPIVEPPQRGQDGWSTEDWRAHFEERAAEFNGGLPRARAEAVAYAWTVHEWLARHFVPSPAECCPHCGGTDRPLDPLLPHGMTSTGHIWTRSSCGPAWHAGRQAEAVAALTAMGIAPPPDFGKNGSA